MSLLKNVCQVENEISISRLEVEKYCYNLSSLFRILNLSLSYPQFEIKSNPFRLQEK